MMIRNLPRFWLAAILFSLAYLSLTSLCSVLFRSPVLSLVVNLAALFGFWLLLVIGGADASLGALRFLSPYQYSNGLFHPGLSGFGISTAAYAGFAAVFLGAAHLVIRSRDL
jgi:hypothetical protein